MRGFWGLENTPPLVMEQSSTRGGLFSRISVDITTKPRVGMYRKSVNRGWIKAMKRCFRHFRSKFKKTCEELSLAADFVIWFWSSGARVNYNLSHKTLYLACSTELHSGFQTNVLIGDGVQILISIPS